MLGKIPLRHSFMCMLRLERRRFVKENDHDESEELDSKTEPVHRSPGNGRVGDESICHQGSKCRNRGTTIAYT